MKNAELRSTIPQAETHRLKSPLLFHIRANSPSLSTELIALSHIPAHVHSYSGKNPLIARNPSMPNFEYDNSGFFEIYLILQEKKDHMQFKIPCFTALLAYPTVCMGDDGFPYEFRICTVHTILLLTHDPPSPVLPSGSMSEQRVSKLSNWAQKNSKQLAKFLAFWVWKIFSLKRQFERSDEKAHGVYYIASLDAGWWWWQM